MKVNTDQIKDFVSAIPRKEEAGGELRIEDVKTIFNIL